MQPLKHWYSDLKKVVFHPRKFFTQMKNRGGYNEPFAFSLTTVGLLAAVAGLMTLSLSRFVLTLVAAFLLWTIVLFAQAFMYHIYLRIMGGHAAYETTFRIFAYLTPLTILLALLSSTVGKNVVLVGMFILLWCYVKYIEINAASYHHRIPLFKGAVAILAFPLLVALLFVLAVSFIGDIPLQQLVTLYYNYSI